MVHGNRTAGPPTETEMASSIVVTGDPALATVRVAIPVAIEGQLELGLPSGRSRCHGGADARDSRRGSSVSGRVARVVEILEFGMGFGVFLELRDACSLFNVSA